MLKYFLLIIRFFFTKPKPVVSSPEKDRPQSNSDSSTVPLVEPVKQQRELGYFTRKNNLVAEYSHDPTIISSSKFGSWDDPEPPKPVGFLQANGDITTERFGGKVISTKADVNGEDELLADDVEFLKAHPNYVGPPKQPDDTVVLTSFPQKENL